MRLQKRPLQSWTALIIDTPAMQEMELVVRPHCGGSYSSFRVRPPLSWPTHRRKGCSPSVAPQPSSGVDRSGWDGCGIHEGDGGAKPRATGVLARSLDGPSHCAHSRQRRRSSGAARVAHICENCDVPSPCVSNETAISCSRRCADESPLIGCARRGCRR